MCHISILEYLNFDAVFKTMLVPVRAPEMTGFKVTPTAMGPLLASITRVQHPSESWCFCSFSRLIVPPHRLVVTTVKLLQLDDLRFAQRFGVVVEVDAFLSPRVHLYCVT